MNIKELHQLTGELIAKGHGLEDVAIDKNSFTDPYEEDGGTILTVDSAEIENVEVAPFEGEGSEDSMTEKFLVLRGE